MVYLSEAEATELARLLLEDYNVEKIVDVGDGSSTKALSIGGAKHVHAVDINEDALKEVRGYPHVIAVKTDASSMKFPYKALNMSGLGLYAPDVAVQVIRNAISQNLTLIALSPVLKVQELCLMMQDIPIIYMG